MYLQIYGERHSGTNWLRRLLCSNLWVGSDRHLVENKKVTGQRLFEDHGWKHGFVDKNLHDSDTSNTGFLPIVRDPYEWLVSMYRNPHHLHPAIRRLPFVEFIRAEWHCIRDHASSLMDGSEIMEERNPETGERFRNIFELRQAKAHSFLSLQDYVEKFHMLRYEDLVESPETQIRTIAAKFELEVIADGACNVDASKRLATPFPPSLAKIVTDLLDWELETKLGYTPRANASPDES